MNSLYAFMKPVSFFLLGECVHTNNTYLKVTHKIRCKVTIIMLVDSYVFICYNLFTINSTFKLYINSVQF